MFKIFSSKILDSGNSELIAHYKNFKPVLDQITQNSHQLNNQVKTTVCTVESSKQVVASVFYHGFDAFFRIRTAAWDASRMDEVIVFVKDLFKSSFQK